MSLLSMTANYSDPAKPPKAETILKLATLILKMLRGIEKELAKTKGEKYRAIPWSVRIYMFSDRAIAEFDAHASRDPGAENVASAAQYLKLPDVEGVA